MFAVRNPNMTGLLQGTPIGRANLRSKGQMTRSLRTTISGSNKYKMAAAAILEKIQMAISPQPVVRSSSCLVIGWGFRGRRI